MNFVCYAAVYEEVNLICVARATTVGLVAFVQAYDLMTWNVAATACLFLAGAIAAMATKTTDSFSSNVLSSLPVVLMLLIQRFYSYGQVVRSASRQIVLVITLWAFGAMLLGMCYSGNMVSELSSPSLPECPHYLRQLAEIEEYPIYTDFWVADEDQRPVAYLHYQIDLYLRKYADTQGSLLPTLRQFGNKLTSVLWFSSQLNPSNQNTSSSSRIVLAYVALKNQVKAHGVYSMTGSRNVPVLRGGNLPFFNSRYAVLVQSNFLGGILQRFLRSLCECGIYKYWRDGVMAYSLVSVWRAFERTQRRVLEIEWMRKSNLAVIWRKFNSELVVGRAPWNGVTFENLNAAFQVFGICMMLALCCFMKEGQIFQLVAHNLLQLTQNIPIFLNRIADDFVRLLHRVDNRLTSLCPATVHLKSPSNFHLIRRRSCDREGRKSFDVVHVVSK